LAKSSPNLTMDQVKALLWTVGEHSPRDYLILKLMTMFGLSVGEVVGSDPRGWNKETKTWFAKEPDIPGLMIEDLKEDGIQVHGKKGLEKFVPMPDEILVEIHKFIESRDKGKIFDISVSRVEQVVRPYAKEARLSDWKEVTPNAFQDFFEKHQGMLPDELIRRLSRVKQKEVVGSKIDIPGLTYAPINEQGVILLFGILSHDLKFSVERIRQEYPDAAVIDYRDDPNRGIKKDIEFEFLSSNFSKQKHPIEKCDIIVCWEHDWKNCPKEIEIIELKGVVQSSRIRA